MAIKFYGLTQVPYGCFSNFAPYPFDLDGAVWPTVEHYFQAMKFAGTPRAEAIRLAANPTAAKSKGNSRNVPIREGWDAMRDEVMYRGVKAKFEQYPEIMAVLLGTGDEEIIEDAPRDYYWGIGAKGTGKNKLGQVLMRVREEARREQR